ncbi:MAG: serine protease, partial [Candidatus Peregrinibacteria bacterium]|nr:serine protease [Candidatus Peregrinibacteria bacterium]
MKKLIPITLFILSIFSFPINVFASPELVQIISLEWNEKTQKLEPISLGSGTIIDKNLILTAAHVVRKNNGDPADFCLLCLAGTKSSRTVNCDIAASVISIHENYDAALI